MLKLKYKGTIQESTEQGINTQVTYTGTESECKSAIKSAEYGIKNTEYGYLKSVQIQQEDGDIWAIQYKYSTATNSSANPPVTDTSYGEKSATLSGGMLQLPLEKHPNYLTCWNHYLFGHAGSPMFPAWYNTAKNTKSDDPAFVWGKALSERPDGMVVLADPVKPGVNGYDIATYQVTETAKFRSSGKAGEFVANKLNKISAPDTTFGITGGNWKCDNATVSWRNKAWYATLTYTRSGDSEGWDPDLYNSAIQ